MDLVTSTQVIIDELENIRDIQLPAIEERVVSNTDYIPTRVVLSFFTDYMHMYSLRTL